jgi:hypothetical protein
VVHTYNPSTQEAETRVQGHEFKVDLAIYQDPAKEGREEGKERRNEGGREPVRKEREVTEDWNSHRKGWHLSCH